MPFVLQAWATRRCTIGAREAEPSQNPLQLGVPASSEGPPEPTPLVGFLWPG